MLAPCRQVVGLREPDALDEAALARRRTRVEEEPPVVVADDAAGPGARVVPGAGGAGRQGVRQGRPVDEVAGDGVPDGDVPVPGVRVADVVGAWR